MRGLRLPVAVATVVTVAVLALGLAVLTDSVRLGGSPGPALAARPDRSIGSGGAETAAGTTCRDPLSPTQPLRVWIGGDSLAASLGPALGNLLASTGIAAPTYDSRSSSGLSTPRFFDWPTHAASEMVRVDPEVVVFIMGTNDWTVPLGAGSGTTATTDTGAGAPWRVTYAALVERMLDVLSAPGRTVYWAGAPTLADRTKDAALVELNALVRSVVESRPGARYFDTYGLFSDGDGRYADTLQIGGRAVRVRSSDGVHFTTAGGELLAVSVFDRIDAACDVEAQAQPSFPQRVLVAPGSAPGAAATVTTTTSSTLPAG